MTLEKMQAFIESLLALRASATDEQALAAKDLYPEWAIGRMYSAGDRVKYGGKLYTVLQAHESQETWIPTDAPSLFALVLIPDDNVIPEWQQPDSTNPYKTGDKVTHNGQTWQSTTDNNVWEPGVYGWEVVE